MKNKIIYYILFGLVIFCIIYIICSNNLFKINKNSIPNNGQASKMSIQRTINRKKRRRNNYYTRRHCKARYRRQK